MKKEKEISFNPKARLISVLGEQLIKDATVGLLELIKNSYDADARNVELVLDSLNKPEAKIIIKDDGSGISADVFLNHWMNPASGHKQKQKEKNKRTKLGRLPLGEKGVGRFAAQQIGKKLILISKTVDSDEELYVSIDWTQFDSEEELSDIKVRYLERVPELFKKGKGTYLEISELKTDWKENDIKKISNALKRMKSPFKGANDFALGFRILNSDEDFLKYADIDTSDILEKAHYKLYGIVDRNGFFEFEYTYNIPGLGKSKSTGKVNIIKEYINDDDEFNYEYSFDDQFYKNIKKYGISEEAFKICKTQKGKKYIDTQEQKKFKDFLLSNHISNKEIEAIIESSKEYQAECGGFEVNYFHYHKSNEYMKKIGVPKELVKEYCGINIYRDGIRILPYGEIGNDWLELDKRKIQSSDSIDNNTIIGMIEISQSENKSLQDKTNREGLIEGKSFLQFRNLVKATVDLLEKEKKRDKEADKKAKIKKEVVEESVKDARSNLAKIVSQIENENIPKEQIVKVLKNEVNTSLDRIGKEYTEVKEIYEKEKDLLFNLAGTGLAAERFTHEFARLVRECLDSFKKLKSFINMNDTKINKEVKIIDTSLEALRNDIRLLGPMFYVKKVANEKDLNIKKVIDDTIYLHERFLNQENVKTEIIGDSFNVKMREGSCMQIFSNLIDNSIHWLSAKSETDNRKIRFVLIPKESAVFITDSGPGVIERYKDRIYEPFFSMRTESGGRGLGLYIVKEILDEKGFDINLVTKEDFPELKLLKGASFRISFMEKDE